jgi:hypothetical protein
MLLVALVVLVVAVVQTIKRVVQALLDREIMVVLAVQMLLFIVLAAAVVQAQ